MKTSLFDFHLPGSRIALRPVSPRDSARMLTVCPPLEGGQNFRKEIQGGYEKTFNTPPDSLRESALPQGEGELLDVTIADLPSLLMPGDIMVFNDSRVIPARLIGKRKNATVEILLHKNIGNGLWQCFAKPAKKLRGEDKIVFGEALSATVKYKTSDGQVVLDFGKGEVELSFELEKYGQMPLPPYIEKKRPADAADKTDYQTVYCTYEGSVAAPTAGLHFTPQLLHTIDSLFVRRAQVTLHVGGGTFLPVKERNTDDHVMHSEWASVSPETAKAINAAKQKGGRVIAVGTTSLRTLETAADEQGVVHPFTGETNIFITPGYRFKCVDMLLTNFHLPRSTLFMLVCAFAGTARMKKAYKHAIKNKYRFYSYGDACLLYRA
jgi:S-adenosylmethionine:tRNA ribosyltransferase-isomerase